MHGPQIFALSSSRLLGERIAASADTALARHEERFFEDGEHKFRPLESVRGNDVYVVSSIYGESAVSVNDKLCQLLFFVGAVRDAGAVRVTVVAPYLPYARKDRRTKPRDPLTSRYVAQLFEALRVDCIVTLDVHNASAFENAFRIQALSLDTRRIFIDRIHRDISEGIVAVASPDPGGVKRAQLFREHLEEKIGQPVAFALMEKRRSAGVVSGEMIAGNVADASVFIVDDLISTGGTIARAARAIQNAGARKVVAVAAHGLFVGDAAEALQEPALDRIFITDSIPPFRLPQCMIGDPIEIVSAASLLGEAISRLHANASITELVGGAA